MCLYNAFANFASCSSKAELDSMTELGLKALSIPANVQAACRCSSERSAAHAEPATEWKVEEAVSQKLRCYSQTASCTHRQHLVRTDDGMYLAWQAWQTWILRVRVGSFGTASDMYMQPIMAYMDWVISGILTSP